MLLNKIERNWQSLTHQDNLIPKRLLMSIIPNLTQFQTRTAGGAAYFPCDLLSIIMAGTLVLSKSKVVVWPNIYTFYDFPCVSEMRTWPCLSKSYKVWVKINILAVQKSRARRYLNKIMNTTANKVITYTDATSIFGTKLKTQKVSAIDIPQAVWPCVPEEGHCFHWAFPQGHHQVYVVLLSCVLWNIL